MTDRPTLLVVQPDAAGPLDRFERPLTDAGLELRVVRPGAGEPVPRELAADGLLVLGGDMDSWDDDGYPWLADVRALLRHAGDRGRPTLGICLGAQLTALAYGGRVGRGEHGLAAGVTEVRRRAEAADDPLVGALPATFPAATMHGDEITALPTGARWLADGTPYPHQAFRLGDRTWGVQFHPEVSVASYRTWVDSLGGDVSPSERAAYLSAVVDRDVELAATAETLSRAFAGLLTR